MTGRQKGANSIPLERCRTRNRVGQRFCSNTGNTKYPCVCRGTRPHEVYN